RNHRRIMVRLVKGAYWDSEIKRAQVDGLAGYPVFTRKAYTDVSYLACARKLLAQPAAIYPQFATHNAQTLAAVYEMAGPDFRPGQYEFQCLHGMGEPLYEQVVAPVTAGGLGRPCRIYAPVGSHATLLAYLVRRLLENGANTSFVNRIADCAVPIGELVADPVATVEAAAMQDGILGMPHPRIALPRALFGGERINSAGVDLADEQRLAALSSALLQCPAGWRAAPVIDGAERTGDAPHALRNPADHHDVVGDVHEATPQDVADALDAATRGATPWADTPPATRADALLRAADLMETGMDPLIGLIVHEAGKTYANAVGEIREAVDFLRYYATQARRDLAAGAHVPLGIVVCISPWNFPLSIFTGQVAAALAAGNSVIAKPAEQTPLIAAQAVRLLLAGGVPVYALQLLPGRGEVVGANLVADRRVRGVVFTGSNEVARLLQCSLAGRLDTKGRLPTLIAETGGQNAMIVDSSALAEQAVNDALVSAFDSAGQRCSALRLLCVQDDVAGRVVTMLRGAMQELCVGNPDRLATDVGPVVDEDARRAIEAHIDAMRRAGRTVWRSPVDARCDALHPGTFVAPTLIELERIDELQREVFGPVLHILRYRRDDLGAVVAAINATGYGLTLGVHTRIDETIDFVVARAHVGNIYVNRTIIGAVVGVQPFGGEGLSGTGPKAGGPLYLHRLLACPADVAAGHAAGNPPQLPATPARPLLLALRDWVAAQPALRDLLPAMDTLACVNGARSTQTLPGPTGERNTYSLRPRKAVLCVAATRNDLLLQLATVLAAGSGAIWIHDEVAMLLRHDLPAALQRCVAWDDVNGTAIDAALAAADDDRVRTLSERLAQRTGPIIGLQAVRPGARISGVAAYAIDRLQVERSVSVNTAAAGGNASLMTIG
ncbi:MAG: bifunctional proline dehydrogenase/L-glutamate gamma-semialdehyde dehydrogenase PutA, partial [Casimicrobiaceae bacterium]